MNKKSVKNSKLKSNSFVERDADGNITIKSNSHKKFSGINVSAKSGKVDTKKQRNASVVGFDGIGSSSISAYRSAYMNSGSSVGAFGDVPLPFVLLNENNGGIFYWPVTLKEKYSWYRFFAKEDPVVGAAIDLQIELPLSKLMLKMPKVADKELREKILSKYENVMKKLNLFSKMQSVLREYLVIGNSFNFLEWDEENKEWSKMIQLIPEEVDVTTLPLSDYSLIKYKPEVLTRLIKKLDVDFENINSIEEIKDMLPEEEYMSISSVPLELIKQLYKDGAVVIDSDPYINDTNQVGSFVHHFARSKQEYEDYGVSILERVLNPLILRELYKNTQVGLATRNMTPKNKISAPGITASQLEDLREQIDLSYLNPDYSIVTNFEWHWEQIGSEHRLLDLSKEYENIDQQLYSALGVTRELLTGEGMYSGSKISIEILNTRCLLIREMFQEFIEKRLFEPMAEANDFFEYDKFGVKKYLYPRISFNRLTIRDNAEVFDSLFQLYQKGSLPVDIIYDLFNLNTDEINEKLTQDMFTPKDSQFNELVRSVYSACNQKVGESNLPKTIIESLKGPKGEEIKVEEQQDNEDDGWGDFDFGGDDDDFYDFTEDDFDDTEPDDSLDFSEDFDDESNPDDSFGLDEELDYNEEEDKTARAELNKNTVNFIDKGRI
jgi:hypothetical protein